jgi:ficolin
MRDPADVYGFSEYNFFLVSGAADDYKMAGLGTYSGTGGDSLTAQHKGQKFSTFEKDHDNSGDNCAAIYNGGWWYNACHESNLNGAYGVTETAKGVMWYAFRGHTVSLKTTEMKIRPK